jgi:hypothetical protein
MRPRLLSIALALAALTACGSTVADSTITGGGLPPGDAALGSGLAPTDPSTGLAINQPEASDAGTLMGSGGEVGDGGGSVGSVGGARSAPERNGSGTDDQVGNSSAAKPTASGPGVTDTTIAIGLPFTSNGRAAAAAFGATGEGIGGGDQRQMWNAILGSVNGSGGVLGRKLVPVFHEYDATSSEPQASQEQAACATWTEDNKVFWVSSGASDTLVPCLHKAGVAQSGSALTDASTSFYQQFPYYVEAGTLQMDRVAAALPERLHAQGFFGKWNTASGAAGVAPVKVGIVSFNDPRTTFAVDKVLVPGLRRFVSEPPEVVKINTPQSSADNGSSIAAIQNATLRFREAGVTHVLPFETQGAGVGTFFAQGADQQKYYPRYGLTSGNGAQVLIDAGLWPRSQLNGAMGFGWLPLVDVRNVDNPDDGPDSNDARRSCLEIMRKAEIDASSAIVKRQALESCNTIRLLKASLEAGGPAVNRAAFLAGVHRLGRSFQSGTTFATLFDPSHHDGVSQVRPIAYMPACECIRYSGPRIAIP